MKDEIIFLPKLEIFKELKEKKFNNLVEYAAKNKKALIACWNSQQRNDIELILRQLSARLSYFENSFDASAEFNAIYRLGTLLGTIECLENILYEEHKNRLESVDLVQKGATIKHLNEVIKLLEKHGILTHSDLCHYLSLNPSTLSEAMKKILPTRTINITQEGKYKVYSLSDIGVRYGKAIRRNKAPEININEILKQLEIYVTSISSEEVKKLSQDLNVQIFNIDLKSLENSNAKATTVYIPYLPPNVGELFKNFSETKKGGSSKFQSYKHLGNPMDLVSKNSNRLPS